MSNLSADLDKEEEGEEEEEEDVGLLESISNHEATSDADLEGDTWIEELECALLADCDPATLKKFSEGRRVPAHLRPDYWRNLLALIDTEKVKLTSEYDLDNQTIIRQDCERLVLDISENLSSEPLAEAERLRLMSDFESTLTTYVKARPELSYVSDNGWTDILKVLYNLSLSDTLLYQMFFRIVDRYIPKDLSDKPATQSSPSNETESSKAPDTLSKEVAPNEHKLNPGDSLNSEHERSSPLLSKKMPKPPSSSSIHSNFNQPEPRKSVQAYHLLRLLIQYHDPELCSILDSRKITPKMWVKDWFCSLFARSCSPKLSLLIWDTHFRMADPFLIFFAAIVMVVNASDELKSSSLDQSRMLDVLKAMPSKLEEDDIEDLYDLVSNYYTNSTPRSIRCYSHLFFMDTFGNTYLGNESPEDGQPLLDLKTTQLTNSLDLSQYLCLPIVPAEIFTLDTVQFRSSSPTLSSSTLRYFLVDCRPAEQYNAGHLTKAFHLDCSLMLREPSSFATAVQALLEIQRQVVASKSSTGGRHLCFIGSGHEEEDRYVNMVVASFLQKYQKYVSIVVGGFEAIHDYVKTKIELRDSFNTFIVDHNEELCKACYSKSRDVFENFKNDKGSSLNSGASGLSSAQSLFASTTSFFRGDKGVLSGSGSTFSKLPPGPQATANLIAQSGASMFDNFTRVIASSSSVAKIKDRCGEILKMPTPSVSSYTTSVAGGGSGGSGGGGGGRGHVSSQDKLGKRYTGGGGGLKYAIDDEDEYDDLSSSGGQLDGDNAINEPIQEIQIDTWQQQTKILASYKCAQIKGNSKYPGYVALSRTHLWILREIPHNKGFASIAAKRPLDKIVQITSKRRQPDLIIFRYGYTNQANQSTLPPPTPPQPLPEAASGGGGGLETEQPKGEHENSQAPKIPKSLPIIVASDQLHIPQAFEVIRLIKREIVRIMDENSKNLEREGAVAAPPPLPLPVKQQDSKIETKADDKDEVSQQDVISSAPQPQDSTKDTDGK